MKQLEHRFVFPEFFLVKVITHCREYNAIVRPVRIKDKESSQNAVLMCCHYNNIDESEILETVSDGIYGKEKDSMIEAGVPYISVKNYRHEQDPEGSQTAD